MFWAALGVGMLINTVGGMVGGGPGRADAQRMHQQSMRSLRNTLNETTNLVGTRREAQVQSRFSFDFEPPAYPQQNFENLQRMQMDHAQQRQGFADSMRQQLGQMKEEFFTQNHYEMGPGPDGKPQVLTDSEGQPLVAKGPENPEQKPAREEFDLGRRQQLAERQDVQKDAFLNKEKQEIQKFLAQNQDNLSNPQVQAELTRMVVGTQKRAFGMQQQHEDERWKADLPPSEEIAAAADTDLAELRQLERDQARNEEQSPDMKALLQHEQDVAILLGDQKEEARRQKAEESFLVDPRKALAVQTPEVDLGEVLPAYLSNSLFNMGIYTV